MKQKTKAVYAGSFDPLTMGHVWVINEAYQIFDELVIAIGVNPDKHPMFTLDERREMISKTLECYGKCCEIAVFENKFLVNFAREIGATHIVRGMRNIQDFEFERLMQNINLDIQGSAFDDRPQVQTVFLIPPRPLCEVSSGAVKALCGPEGWKLVVHGWVPHPVFKVLEKKYG